MTTLRILLLVAGVAFIVGVWWWSRRQQRVRGAVPSRRVERLPPEPSANLAHTPSSRDEDDEDLDIAATLADLSGLMREGRDERSPPSVAAAGESTRRRPAKRRHPQQIDMGFPEELPDSGQRPQLPERVIALYVQARAAGSFRGAEVADAFDAVGMRFGDMSIFHHFGVGNMVSAEPVFSAANMFEPGVFDPATLDEFETRGLAFFMQLPGRDEASLAFELMLNTVQRVARELHGEVLDDTRAPLSSHGIEQLRALVRPYDRK
jgi:cell division protein ZipA